MRVRSLGWVAGLMATCATALPVHADASDKATDTCIQAFVDTYLPKDQQVQVRAPSAAPTKLEYSSNATSSGNGRSSPRPSTAHGRVASSSPQT